AHASAVLCDLIDHILTLLTGGKAFVPSGQTALTFYKDRFRPVDHDLGHRLVLDQLLKDVQLAHGTEQLLPQFHLLLQGKAGFPELPQDQAVDLSQDIFIPQLPGQIQFLHQKPSQYLKILTAHSPSFLITSLTYSPSSLHTSCSG